MNLFNYIKNHNLHSKRYHILAFFIILLVVIFLVFINAIKVTAANVTWRGTAGDGLWTTPGNWSNGQVPTASDVVIFNNTCINCTVNINTNPAVSGVTVSGSNIVLNMGSSTMTVTGNFTYTAGTINAGTSTVQFGNGSRSNHTINANNFSFYNLTINNSDRTVTVANGTSLIVLNTFKVESTRTLNGGTIDIRGDVTNINSTITGSTIIQLTGNALQNINVLDLPNSSLVINKTGGSVNLINSVELTGNIPLTITSGIFNQNGYSLSGLSGVMINADGSWENVTANNTTTTLTGNVVNNGSVTFDGGGLGCGGSDSVEIISSNNTTRSWSGTGTFNITDVAVRRQSGTVTVFSSTNNGNTNWIFAVCPPVPNILTVSSQGTQVPSIIIPSVGKYLGGAFTFDLDNDTATITDITLSLGPSNTVSGSDITNIDLYYYEQSTCSSFIPNNATLFGSASSFTGGSVNISGSIPLDTDSVCLYVELDISPNASVGEVLDIEIANPGSDITAPGASSIVPASTIGIAGISNLIEGVSIVGNMLEITNPLGCVNSYYVEDSALWVQESGDVPCPAEIHRLTSNKVSVKDLSFTEVNYPDTPKAVRIMMTLSDNSPSNLREFKFEKTFTTTTVQRK